jgi:hypothetical protein
MQKKKSIKTNVRNQGTHEGSETELCQYKENYLQTTKKDDSIESMYELQKLAA